MFAASLLAKATKRTTTSATQPSQTAQTGTKDVDDQPPPAPAPPLLETARIEHIYDPSPAEAGKVAVGSEEDQLVVASNVKDNIQKSVAHTLQGDDDWEDVEDVEDVEGEEEEEYEEEEEEEGVGEVQEKTGIEEEREQEHDDVGEEEVGEEEVEDEEVEDEEVEEEEVEEEEMGEEAVEEEVEEEEEEEEPVADKSAEDIVRRDRDSNTAVSSMAVASVADAADGTGADISTSIEEPELADLSNDNGLTREFVDVPSNEEAKPQLPPLERDPGCVSGPRTGLVESPETAEDEAKESFRPWTETPAAPGVGVTRSHELQTPTSDSEEEHEPLEDNNLIRQPEEEDRPFAVTSSARVPPPVASLVSVPSEPVGVASDPVRDSMSNPASAAFARAAADPARLSMANPGANAVSSRAYGGDDWLHDLLPEGPVAVPLYRGYNRIKTFAEAVLSKVSYGPASKARLDTLMPKVFGKDYRSGYCFEREAAVAILVENHDSLHLSWRGTDDAQDWLHNAKFFATSVPFMKDRKYKVHSGFLEYTSMLMPAVLRKLDELLAEKPRPVFISGHSLGGAAAVISAMQFEAHRGSARELASVITFGQPRVVNRPLAEFLERRWVEKYKLYFRYTHNNDIVPRLPTGFFVYEHFGSHVHITWDGKMKNVLRNPSYWELLRDRITGLIKDSADFDVDGISDHEMIDYVRAGAFDRQQ